MTHGSLFTGICGLDLGFESAGIPTLWQVELDRNCRAVERRHFPRAQRWETVCEVEGHRLAPVDIISFGSPCQDLSIAGEQAGILEGERSRLFFHAIRIISEMRYFTDGHYPSFVVWENVPGALSSTGRRDFACVLGAFQLLGAADIAWRILDARWFGVAQRRRRVFAVVDFAGERAGEILFEPDRLPRHHPPRKKTTARTPGRADARTAARRFWAQVAALGGGGAVATGEGGVMDVSGTLSASGSGTQRTGNARNESDMLVAMAVGTKMGRCNSTQETLVAGAVNAGYGKRGYAPDEMHNYVAAPITTDPYADRAAEEVNLVLQDVAETLTGSWHNSQGQKAGNNAGLLNPVIAMSGRWRGDDGRGYDRPPHISDLPSLDCTKVETVAGPRIGVRRLTPVECARLQGFPDDWAAWGINDLGLRVEMSDAAQYRMYGNAVCRNVAEWLGFRIVNTLKGTPTHD